MALDTTVGGANANSYATLAEAEAYHAARLHNADWTGATDPTKESALKWAALLLDRENWKGWRVSEAQALAWPRAEIWDRDGFLISVTAIPFQIKRAQSELAMLLIQGDRTADPGTAGFKKIKVDVIELEIDSMDRVEIINPTIFNMIKEFVHTGIRLERG